MKSSTERERHPTTRTIARHRHYKHCIERHKRYPSASTSTNVVARSASKCAYTRRYIRTRMNILRLRNRNAAFRERSGGGREDDAARLSPFTRVLSKDKGERYPFML
ncbi:hypothetical protein Trydic_g3762 [Trypoxylus dichotomus]